MSAPSQIDSSGTTPRVAVVGCGHWGRNIVRNLAELKALAAVIDTDPAARLTASSEFGVPAVDFTDLLEDPSVAALAVATPAATHYTLARAALLAGKHVFVEKPLSLRVDDAEDLCATARACNRTLMVGHLLQYHPAYLTLKEIVRSGALGRLQYLYSNRLNLGRFRREEDILWSFAPHDISMILGLVDEEPVRVEAVGSAYLHDQRADVTTTHLRFASGVNAHVYVSWLHPFKEQKLVVVGTAGMAAFDDNEPWDAKLRLWRHRVDWRDGKPAPIRADVEAVPLQATEPLKEELLHFLNAMRSGEPPRTDGEEGTRVLRVLAASERSVASASAAEAPSHVHASAYVDVPAEIGAGTRVWHFSHILPNTKIGADCTIGQNVVIGPNVVVGDRCKIQNNVSIFEGVTLEDGVFCGPSCVFTNVSNPRAEVSRRHEFAPTIVRRGATIGANATIVCGHEIGAYAFIAAGAVVTSDVPAHALMVGVPARRVGWVSHDGEPLGEDLVCPRSGTRYEVTDEGELVVAQ